MSNNKKGNMGHNQPQFSVNSLSPEDKKKIKTAISVMTDSLTRMDAERDLIKAEAEALYATLGMPAKMSKKLARTKHKASFNNETEEFRLFETLFETVVE